MAHGIEFCRFFLGWSYPELIETFCNDIDNLNPYNLSNHFNFHTKRETIAYWREVREREQQAGELRKNMRIENLA